MKKKTSPHKNLSELRSDGGQIESQEVDDKIIKEQIGDEFKKDEVASQKFSDEETYEDQETIEETDEDHVFEGETDEEQATEDYNGDEPTKDDVEESTMDDPPSPLRLRYKFRTTQDEIGYFPGRVTVRCRMGSAVENLVKAVENMNDDVIHNFLHRVGLEYFLKINIDGWKNCFHGLLCHYLLLREIKTKKNNEMWFLIRNKPVRFGMREFCLITGLNCSPLPSDDECMKVFNDGMCFVEKVKNYCFGLKGGNEKKTLIGEDLLRVVRCRSKKFKFSDTERAGCAALYIIHSILLATEDTKQVQENYLAWVVNPIFFASYPWGRVCFEFTLSSLKKNLDKKAKDWERKVETSNSKKKKPQPYTIGGFTAAFLVWAYEAVDVFGVHIGKKSLVWDNSLPRIVRWHSEKTPQHLPYNWYDDLINKNEVHCIPIMKPSEEEARSEWIHLFEELEDEEDEIIDKLVNELEKINILGPLDGIEEQPQREERQDYQRELEHINRIEDDCLHQSSMQTKETCACDISILKKLFVKIDKKLTYLVKILDVKARTHISHSEYMSPSWR